MTRVVSVTFLVLYLTSATEVGEILRLPMLVLHYFEHAGNSTSDLSFGDFIEMHYPVTDFEDTDDEHNNLPFHHHDSVACGVSGTSAIPVTFSFLATRPASGTGRPTCLKVERPYNCIQSEIWQPPKAS